MKCFRTPLWNSVAQCYSCNSFCPPKTCRCTTPCVPRCPDFPDVQCIDVKEVYATNTQTYSNSAINIIDAFNPNDGSAPWTVLNADLIGTQQAIYDLNKTIIDGERHMSGTVKPTLLVNYQDDLGINRSKLMSFPDPVPYVFPLQDSGAIIGYHVDLLPGATITSPSNSNSTVSITATYSLQISAYSDSLMRVPIVQGHSCEMPPSCAPAACVSVKAIKNACKSCMISLRGTVGDVDLSLAFPATLTIRDNFDIYFQQEPLVYVTLNLTDFPFDAGDLLIAGLFVEAISVTSNTGAFFSPSITISGLIMAVMAEQRVLAASHVNCGPYSASCCAQATPITSTATNNIPPTPPLAFN